jgi:hypothetical protein
VNLDKLASQLRRDLAANPKKAAALGLMVVVALYCWGPLVWGFVQSAQKQQAGQAEMAKLILTDDPLQPADKSPGRAKAKFHWERVRPTMSQDPYMASATFDAVWADPFGIPAGSTEEASEAPLGVTSSIASSAPLDFDPAEAGLVLTSVAIGAKRRGATISGERYYVGDSVPIASKDGTAPLAVMRVTNITPEGVELQGQGKTFTLRLVRPRLASGDAIERGASDSNP